MSYFRVTKPQMRALIRIVDNETVGARNPFRYNNQTLFALFRRGLVGLKGAYVVPTAKGASYVESRRTDR